MDKRYYKKKGETCKEMIRCPLCGMHRRIIYFSQTHLFGIYQICYGGYKKIAWRLIEKSPEVMIILREDIAKRLLELLEEFTGIKWFSQDEVNDIVSEYKRMIAVNTLTVIPSGMATPTVATGVGTRGVRAHNVVVVK